MFASYRDLEIISTSVNVNIPTLAYAQAVREGMFTLTHVAIISRPLKLVNVSLIEHFILYSIKLIAPLEDFPSYYKSDFAKVLLFELHF